MWEFENNFCVAWGLTRNVTLFCKKKNILAPVAGGMKFATQILPLLNCKMLILNYFAHFVSSADTQPGVGL